MNFTNKVVWITGASSGIGKALAIQLSKLDAKLILSARNEEKLNVVKQECENSEMIKILPLDLENYSNFDVKVTEAINWFGRIDVLVNNGGISQRSLASETLLDVDKRIMDINYLGTVALTKALLPHFIDNKNAVTKLLLTQQFLSN
jgi:short-subunit dehydrogenase